MKRRLFNMASILSLVLLVATWVVWARSYWHSDAIVYSDASGLRAVQWMCGTLVVGVQNQPVGAEGIRIDTFRAAGGRVTSPGTGFWRRLGFENDLNTAQLQVNGGEPVQLVARRLMAPLWSVALLWAVLPMLWVAAYRRRRKIRLRREQKLCVNCGYDLRATPDRCPECGRAADFESDGTEPQAAAGRN